MSVPTEPGWSWWRHPRYRNGKWTITRVRAAHAGVGLMHSPWGGSICHSWRAVPGEGEWGERIPDNDTLKAMREILAEGPWVHHQQDAPWCLICHADSPTHDPDCPWLRAQETQDVGLTGAMMMEAEQRRKELIARTLARLCPACKAILRDQGFSCEPDYSDLPGMRTQETQDADDILRKEFTDDE